jgi:hypothetical protein
MGTRTLTPINPFVRPSDSTMPAVEPIGVPLLRARGAFSL